MLNWNNHYKDNNTPWDIGFPSPPLQEYIDQLTDKTISILVPGAGNAHEVAYLHKEGYTDVTIVDLAQVALDNFKNRNPDFPHKNLILGDFFDHEGQYDLILEQTFLSALSPQMSQKYVEKMHELLKPEGKLVGVLFSSEFDKEGPPFGGTLEKYTQNFSKIFEIIKMEKAYNSIKPRAGSELFFQVTPLKY